ncbi:HDOD domain-containing protein [Massilia niabensis]|uniref:HDOD domain-containing protein n=1 Tax=Massilia niabensis TaxID=544910 RepID=A0ABW0L9D4_9BURK
MTLTGSGNMGWLDKLLGGENADKRSAVASASPVPAHADQRSSAAEIDATWYRWLAAALPPYAVPDREQRVLDELARLAEAPLAGAALVPRMPEIIPQLMRSLRDDSMNAAELSRQLSQDLVLVAEVFREANRPAYLPRYHAGPPVSSIEAAIMLLGQNGMRMLLARVAFRPIIGMGSGRHARRVAPAIWRQSETCALAASRLAPSMRANPFEAYLAGLMENIGLVVAFRLIDQVCPGETLPHSDAFIAALFNGARVLSARIAALWEFPDPVTQAIAAAGGSGANSNSGSSALAQALALGDRLAKLRQLVDGAVFQPDAPVVTDGLTEAALDCFDRLGDEE